MRKGIILMQLGPCSSSLKRFSDSIKCTLTLRPYTLKMPFEQVICGLFWLLSQDKVFYKGYYVVRVAKIAICYQNNFERENYSMLWSYSALQSCSYTYTGKCLGFPSAVTHSWAGMGMLCSFIWTDSTCFHPVTSVPQESCLETGSTQGLELSCIHAKAKGLLHTRNNSPPAWTRGWSTHPSPLQLLPLHSVFTLPLLNDGRQAAGWKQWLVFSNWQHFNKYKC